MSVSSLIRLPLRLIPDSAVLPILSGPLRGAHWVVGSGRKAYWLGIYERHFQRALARSLTQRAVLYDIGANVGFYSLLAAKQGARVIAFEPSPTNAAFLRRNLELNKCRVDVFEMALSNYDGWGQFADDGAVGALAPYGTVRVKTAALDSLLLPPPTHIKMDVEGAELDALNGARVTIQKNCPMIFLGVHSHQLHRDCAELLRAWGFTVTATTQLENGCADLIAISPHANLVSPHSA